MPPSDFPANGSVASPAPALDLALVRRRLKSGRLGAQLHYFTELDSTNTRARELAAAGAAQGEVVLAESQTQGRGRLGRRWESPAFRNLYLSIILRPKLAPALTQQITLMAAVAVAETVGFFIGRPPEIKWPNDILADGKKLAGILAEAAFDAKRVEYVVLGIGVNVDYRAETMPETLRPRATSIAEAAGQRVSRDRVLIRLIQHLDRCYAELEESGFVALQPRWEAHFGLRGKQVRIDLGGETFLGRALGIDRKGALIVATEDGQRRSVVAGDVVPLEP
jgi:BirA family biotin operon repressor/biotin-[acetyl-CoA-carboxylase] ligase